MDTNKLINTEWKDKSCDVCGSEERDLLGERNIKWPTRKGIFSMEFKDCICRNCGNVYIGQVPEENFLNSYYANAFYYDTHSEHYQPDYDANARSQLIETFVDKGQSILEVGANNGYFCEYLQEHGYTAEGMDILQKNEGAGYAKAPRTYDAIVSYFVLEHITDPQGWFKQLLEYAHVNTVFVVEIPHFNHYPMNSLNHEHFLNFNEYHLSLMMSRLGFKTLYTGDKYQSRYFGFCGVFVQKEANVRFTTVSVEEVTYEDNLSVYREFRSKQQAYQDSLSDTAQAIKQANGELIVWGANRIASDLALQLAEQGITKMTLIDNSEQKQGLCHVGFSQATQSPHMLSQCSGPLTIVVCAQSAYTAVVAQIESLTSVEKIILPAQRDSFCGRSGRFELDLQASA